MVKVSKRRWTTLLLVGAFVILTILGIYSSYETLRIEAEHQRVIDRLRQHPDAQEYFTQCSYTGTPLSSANVRPCFITKRGDLYYTDDHWNLGGYQGPIGVEPADGQDHYAWMVQWSCPTFSIQVLYAFIDRDSDTILGINWVA